MFELPGANHSQPPEQSKDFLALCDPLKDLTVSSQKQSRRVVLEPEHLGQKPLAVDVPLSLEGYAKGYGASCLKLGNGSIDYIFQQIACATMFQESKEPILFQSATGSGKTIIALVSAAPLLSKAGGKVLFVTPDYVLVDQIVRDTTIVYKEDTVSVLKVTGKLSPAQRQKIYHNTLNSDSASKKRFLCVANPEVILRDVMNGVLALKQFSAVFFDEVHVAVGEAPYLELARLCPANLGQKQLFFSAWPARTKSDRTALMDSVGAEYFVKLDTPGTRVVDSVERVSLYGKMERAEKKLRSAIHDVTIGLGKTLKYTQLSSAVFEDKNLERISKLLAQRVNDRDSLDDRSNLFSEMTTQNNSGSKRKEIPKGIYDPEKIQSGPLKVDRYGHLSSKKEIDAEELKENLPKILEGLKNWQSALLQKLRKISLQKTAQGWIVKTPSAGEFLSFQRNFDGLFTLTKDIEKSVVFGSAKSLLSELGHLRHLHSVLVSQGQYAFLDFALNGLACVRLEGGGHQYLKRVYRDRPSTGAYPSDHSKNQSTGAIAEIANGTPYELLFQKGGWEEIVQELDGPSNLQEIADYRKFFNEHCFDFMVRRKEWDHPKEALEHRWIENSENLIGDGKILLRVEQANVAHFRKARIECHRNIGAESIAGNEHMSKTELSAALERFRSPDVKVLVFTKVGTQGLDIKEGKLLLVETPPLVSTDLVQLRGRIGRREKLLDGNQAPGIMVTLLTTSETSHHRTQDEIRHVALTSQINKKERDETSDGRLQFESYLKDQ